MFSHFFIERPIFASVLSIVITLAGAVAAANLPVAQYPPITPPSIVVMCNYPGANSHVVADSVAAPIEQQVNGVEGMMYMVSQSNNDGSYTLTVTFKPGINLNFAQVLVQNRVNLALPLLPDVVKLAGVTTRKRNPDILQVIGLYSPKGRYDQLYLSNYATIRIRDELARVPGVGDVQQFGQQDYSMRLWVDPERLAALNLTASDVAAAVREQNMQVTAGHFGQQSAGANGAMFEFTVRTLGRLSVPEQFDEIILHSDNAGRQVRLKDVGHAALGARNMDTTNSIDGRPAASIALWALPDANAIATAQRVREKMEQLKKEFPEDLDYVVALDMTPFIQESIDEVIRTLIEAVVLVAAVVLLFLQNWRSALIPLVTVPVAIIGTFAVMAAIGFSLNCLTLFGLVLAIGIVVDDAIVVVEAVEHHIQTGLTPHQAAHKAMEQVSGPVVAVALVLSAVFVPCAFISGITGQFFRQFALTIAVSTIISAFNSLTLSPALAAILLQPRGAKKDMPGRILDGALGGLFRLFNATFRSGTAGYTRLVGASLTGRAPLGVLLLAAAGGWFGWQLPLVLSWLRQFHLPPRMETILLDKSWVAAELRMVGGVVLALVIGGLLYRRRRRLAGAFPRLAGVTLTGSAVMLLAYGGLLLNTAWGFGHLPSGYVPNQDQGRFYIAVQLPNAASLQRSQQVMERIGEIVRSEQGVLHMTMVAGQSFTLNANGSNFGQFFVTFDSFENRRDPSLAYTAILERLRDRIDDEVPGALVSIFTPPPVSGLGASSGFKIIIEDRADLGSHELEKAIERLIERSKESDRVERLFCIHRANMPQLYIDLDREQCEALSVDPKEVFATLQIYLGSYYVNDFNSFGRAWQVVVQARGEFRNDVSKVKLLKVRNKRNEMVPLGALLTIKEIGGPINIGRYNMYHASAVLGLTKPGVSTGEGIEEMERLCHEVLPPGMTFEWTEINYMQIDASKNVWNNLIFPLAVVFVFLVLAAQYESWALPLAVILVVPMCILGSLTGVAITGGDINIFTQIGFVVLVGLASKNAILIVEFAKHKREDAGLSRREATLEACQLRLRPILMTSFAFILGVVPLIVGHGAGAEMRKVLGIAVFSGMIGVTLFGIFLTPVFFYVIEGIAEQPLFASRVVRQLGTGLLFLVGVLTLGLPWLLPLMLGKIRGRASRRHGKFGSGMPQPNPGPLNPAAHTRSNVTINTRISLDEEPKTNGHSLPGNGENGADVEPMPRPDDNSGSIVRK
ncbi:MAG: efflux RND transporter permease subunit [Gemmataceae bacterium]|nr:efflux RND transporter permease subunit [Gemmataceae bacterium]